MKTIGVAFGVVALAAVGCATMQDAASRARAVELMKRSFQPEGIAGLDRLQQDETQELCSRYPTQPPKDVAQHIEAMNLATVKYPADGKLLGDWKEGEKIAQSGRGWQFNDTKDTVAGGNCYACHQLAPQELSFGTIGPSLYRFGKLRGNGEAVQKYTWGKIWNSQAYTACSNMPRFGHKGILSENQIRDLVALLLDPESPVNKE